MAARATKETATIVLRIILSMSSPSFENRASRAKFRVQTFLCSQHDVRPRKFRLTVLSEQVGALSCGGMRLSCRMSSNEIAPLTGLRFLAAYAVFVPHTLASFTIPQSNNALVLVGTLSSPAMTLFFMLSGFVLHARYSRAMNLGEFFVARFARLYPLYIVLLIATLGLFRVMRVAEMPYTLAGLPYFLLGIQSWVPVWFGQTPLVYTNALALSWSISTEFFFYLLFPLLSPAIVWLAQRVPASLVAILALLGTPILIAKIETTSLFATLMAEFPKGLGFHWWFQYISPYGRIFEFISGLAIAELYLRDRHRVACRAEKMLASLVATFALAGFLWLHWSLWTKVKLGFELEYDLMAGVLWYAVPLGFLVYTIGRYGLVSLLAHPIVVLLGTASYSLYLAHPLLLQLIKFPIRFSGKLVRSPPVLDAIPYVVAVLCLFAVPWVCVLIHRRFEHPMRVRIKRLRHRTPAPAKSVS